MARVATALCLGVILNRPTMRALNNVVPEINYKASPLQVLAPWVRRCGLTLCNPH